MNPREQAVLDRIQAEGSRILDMRVHAVPRAPMQPVVLDTDGKARFRQNAVVRYLLDKGGLTLSDLADVPFPVEDRSQFLQLLGYSVGGYCMTSDVVGKDEAWAAANLLEGRDDPLPDR